MARTPEEQCCACGRDGCECHRCAAYNPAQGSDSCEEGARNDSASSEAEEEEEQQLPSRNPRRSKRLSLHVKDNPSLADLQKLLQEQCGEDYAAMSTKTPLVFEKFKDAMRLRIGGIRSGFSQHISDVYASIGSKDNSRLRITMGPTNMTVEIFYENGIELDQPFRDVCRYGRMLFPKDKSRLRAILYFWFLEAGHIDTFDKYAAYEEDLVEACQNLNMFGRQKTIPGGSEISGQAPSRADVPAAPQTNRSRPSLAPVKRGSDSNIDHFINAMRNTPNKRIKLEDAVSDMQRRNTKQAESLVVIQQELRQVKAGAEETAKLLRRITGQDKELKRIKDENQALRHTVEEEKSLKLLAQRKLSEYMDAQKKIAAQFL